MFAQHKTINTSPFQHIQHNRLERNTLQNAQKRLGARMSDARKQTYTRTRQKFQQKGASNLQLNKRSDHNTKQEYKSRTHLQLFISHISELQKATTL